MHSLISTFSCAWLNHNNKKFDNAFQFSCVSIQQHRNVILCCFVSVASTGCFAIVSQQKGNTKQLLHQTANQPPKHLHKTTKHMYWCTNVVCKKWQNLESNLLPWQVVKLFLRSLQPLFDEKFLSYWYQSEFFCVITDTQYVYIAYIYQYVLLGTSTSQDHIIIIIQKIRVCKEGKPLCKRKVQQWVQTLA